MKRERIEVYSLDYMIFVYEQRLEEDELLDEGIMEECDRLSVAEMRNSYVEYLLDLASY